MGQLTLIRRLLILYCLIGLSSTLSARTLKVNEKRLIKVIGAVRGSAIGQAAQLEEMSRTSKQPIYILINSPGGAVLPGMLFVQAMEQAKTRGVSIRCVSGVVAASMAFIYLAHCDKRYALANTRLLFHPISIGMDRARVQELVVDLDATVQNEQRIMHYLRNSLNLSWKDFHRPYFAEVFWTAEGLNEYVDSTWITIVDDVKGVGEDLYQWRRPAPLLFGESEDNNSSNVDEIIKRLLGDD